MIRRNLLHQIMILLHHDNYIEGVKKLLLAI